MAGRIAPLRRQPPPILSADLTSGEVRMRLTKRHLS